jgi:hypothetical protein
MDHTTTYDDAHVERQVSPDEGDNVDHGDDSEDIPQPKDPALLVLKENEVYTIGIFRHIYLCMFLKM